MYSIGDRLKDARMSKGFQLDDITQKTNISYRYLRALEEDNLEVLPDETYARSFVRAYADEVGLDGDLMAREFSDENHEYFQNRSAQKSKSTSKSRFNFDNYSDWATIKDSLPMFAVIVLIIAIVVAIYLAATSLKQAPEEPYINQAGEETTYINESDADTAEQVIEFQGLEESTLNYKVVGDHPFAQSIEIKAEAETWTTIALNGETVNEQLLNAGETLSANLEEASTIQVSLGNSSETELLLNGETVPFKEEAADLSTVQINFNFE